MKGKNQLRWQVYHYKRQKDNAGFRVKYALAILHVGGADGKIQ